MDNEDDEEEDAEDGAQYDDNYDEDDDPPMNQLDAFASMKAFDALNQESLILDGDHASSSSSSNEDNDHAQAMDPEELERQVQQEMEEIKKQMYTDPDCSNNIGRCLRVVRMEDVQVQPCSPVHLLSYSVSWMPRGKN